MTADRGIDDVEFREQVRKTLHRVVAPRAQAAERSGCLPRSVWLELGQAGLLASPHSGPDFPRTGIILEELGRLGHCGIRASLAVSAYMAGYYLDRFAATELAELVLAPARAGAAILSLAISEATSGTDLRGVDTVLRRQPNGEHILTGTKSYVANGCSADFFLVIARDADQPPHIGALGLSMIVVGGDQPGVERARWDADVWRSADLATVAFHDVTIAPSRFVGRKGRAGWLLAEALEFERLVAGLLALGGVGATLAELRDWLNTREVAGAALAANSSIRQRAGQLWAEYVTVRACAADAVAAQTEGRRIGTIATALKWCATELDKRAAAMSVQLHGAHGFARASPVARHARDAAAATVAGGASEHLLDVLGRAYLDSGMTIQ